MRQRNSFAVPSLLSVIIPAYRQESSIKKDIATIEATLRSITSHYEIIVVVDGMDDKTYERAKESKSSKVKIFGFEKNQGKGNAVRYGMLQAKGDVIGFIDGGMDINPNGLRMLLNHMEWYNAEIIVGSKLHPVSKVEYPIIRKILSWGYRVITRILFGFKIKDTQVGIKFFKRDVVKKVFPKLLVKRFAFDVEILAVAYNLGYTRIFEAPVEITLSGKSTIGSNSFTVLTRHFWKEIFYMLWDTFAVFYRIKIRNYYKKKTPKSTTLSHTPEILRVKP
jgi:glycosyltransferase involved in cell wall biosynthesis